VCRDNPDVSDVDDSTHRLKYFHVEGYIQFLDTILEQLRFRFNEKTTFAGLFDTLLPTNCANNGTVEEEFMQLYENYSQFLHANNVMPHDTSGLNALAQYRLWVDC
jgi:cellulose biosynthesis protein BcsQ